MDYNSSAVCLNDIESQKLKDLCGLQILQLYGIPTWHCTLQAACATSFYRTFLICVSDFSGELTPCV